MLDLLVHHLLLLFLVGQKLAVALDQLAQALDQPVELAVALDQPVELAVPLDLSVEQDHALDLAVEQALDLDLALELLLQAAQEVVAEI
jgi:hypothetical protein